MSYMESAVKYWWDRVRIGVLSRTDGAVSVQDTFVCDVRGVTVFSLITQTTSEEQAVSKYLEHSTAKQALRRGEQKTEIK